MAANQSALERLADLRAEVEARLLETEDYKTFLALTRAIADISGEAPPVSENPMIGHNSKARGQAQVDVSDLTQADAAHVLLLKVLHEPVLIANLVTALRAHGIKVGGTNANINLSSTLSKDDRFRSVRYNGRACWWVHGTPFPGELGAN